jgi:hypothetical protein
LRIRKWTDTVGRDGHLCEAVRAVETALTASSEEADQHLLLHFTQLDLFSGPSVVSAHREGMLVIGDLFSNQNCII